MHRVLIAGALITGPFVLLGLSERSAGATTTMCRANGALTEATVGSGSDYLYEFAYQGAMAAGTFDVNRSDNDHPGLVPEVGEVPGTDAYIGVFNASGSQQTDVAGWAFYIYVC
jgi:hypothetical protein